jgi:pyruvate dehydrogenase E1 component alpha subunit
MAPRSEFDPAAAYRMMIRMRLVEEALAAAWADGIIPGEYHSGIGEEGINAGVILHLSGRDTMALDHRSTSPLIARGADPERLMLEVMGSEQGLNHGRAGHMHLMEPDLHAVADGIVGASGPLAVGNAIANACLHPGRVSIAFHGEAAANQGMLMEAYNMAVAWKLPVVFVCKDNEWSITTYSKAVTGGDPVERARSFGLAIAEADGSRVREVHRAAGKLIDGARAGKGPGFLHATCHRPGGHFEGDPILRLLRDPGAQAREWGPAILNSTRAVTGGSRVERARGLAVLTKRVGRAVRHWSLRSRMDPVRRGRRLLDESTADLLEISERQAIETAVASARATLGPRPIFGVTGSSR